MSVIQMSQVWRDSPHGGTELLLHLALADFSHDDGTSVYPSNATLADKCRVSPSTVKRNLQTLQKSGHIVLEREGGGRSANRWRLEWPEGVEDEGGQNEPGSDWTPSQVIAVTPQPGHSCDPLTTIDPLRNHHSLTPTAEKEHTREVDQEEIAAKDLGITLASSQLGSDDAVGSEVVTAVIVDQVEYDFSRFWQVVEHKTSKAKCSSAFRKALSNPGVDADLLIDTYTAQFAAHTSQPQYFPRPLSWLNGERWDDEIAAPQLTDFQSRLAASAAFLAEDPNETATHKEISDAQ